jgi:hypothetical protein
MPYQDVIALKIKSSKKILKDVLSVPYLERDSSKMNQALDAIKFNEKLLNEMGIKLEDD